MRPPPVKTNASDFKDARLDEFVKHLDSFDIICNQEVFTTLNTRKQRLITYAKKAGLIYHAVSDPPSLFSGYATDGGLLTLSRFPIMESAFEPFDYGVVSDALSYKGVLYVKILVKNNLILHLFNTHTQASYFWDDLQTFVISPLF
jgi:endonuclease/exonuclease/phosphatase family metal-dependent hydrolase